jgi:hypothetical protein
MISGRRRSTSKSSTQKRPSVAWRDLAEKFSQVQRLRKQVRDLEQLAAADRHRAFAGMRDEQRNERAE